MVSVSPAQRPRIGDKFVGTLPHRRYDPLEVYSAWQGSAEDTSNATVYTFTGQPIGDAATTRFVVVGVVVVGTAGRTISTLTIGGTSAAKLTGAGVQNGNTDLEFWGATVATGTTATVVVTASGACVRAAIFIWSLTNYTGNPAPVVGTDTTLDQVIASPSVNSLTIAVPARRTVLAIGYIAAVTIAAVLTGLTRRTTVAEQVETNGVMAASQDFSTAQASLAVSVSWAYSGSATDDGGILVVALK
jgi:hypothetical protein